MKKILSYLDFLKGKKTKIAGAFTALALIFNFVFKIDLDAQSLTDTFLLLINESEVIVGACGIIYGLVIKLIRPFL